MRPSKTPPQFNIPQNKPGVIIVKQHTTPPPLPVAATGGDVPVIRVHSKGNLFHDKDIEVSATADSHPAHPEDAYNQALASPGEVSRHFPLNSNRHTTDIVRIKPDVVGVDGGISAVTDAAHDVFPGGHNTRPDPASLVQIKPDAASEKELQLDVPGVPYQKSKKKNSGADTRNSESAQLIPTNPSPTTSPEFFFPPPAAPSYARTYRYSPHIYNPPPAGWQRNYGNRYGGKR